MSKVRTGARRADQDFSDATLVLRERGIVPWDWIVDNERHLSEWEYAPTVGDYLVNVLDRIRIDCWDGEPPPLLLCESNGVAGVLQRTLAAEYLCPVAGTKGQTRGFLETEVGPMLEGPHHRVLYIGDWDWQGHQIEAHTRRRLEEYVGGELYLWERLALNEDQLVERNLARLKIRKKDRRYKPALEYDAVEAETLGQREIMDIVRDWLDELLPEPLDDVLERSTSSAISCESV